MFLSNAHLALYVLGGVIAIYWATFAVRVAGSASTAWMTVGLLVIVVATIALGGCALFAFAGRTGGDGYLGVNNLLGLSMVYCLALIHCLALACLALAMIRSATPTLPSQRRRTYA